MAFKDLLVHADRSKHCAQRLDVAVHLALTFDAHLAGLYTAPEPYVSPYVAGPLTPDLLELQRKLIADARDGVKADFEERMRKAGIAAEWREVEGEPARMAALHARYADLMVVGQNDPDEPVPDPDRDLPERVVLESGRPVLVVPYAGRFPILGQRVLVAWNASAQATRAVNDALPLLARAAKVTVMVVNPASGGNGHGEVPGADIALHLARHGVNAEANHVYGADVDVGNMILSRAADFGADLIVMGAYGHSRLREMVLGGATRTLFQSMTAPVFMSH